MLTSLRLIVFFSFIIFAVRAIANYGEVASIWGSGKQCCVRRAENLWRRGNEHQKHRIVEFVIKRELWNLAPWQIRGDIKLHWTKRLHS